MVVDEAADVPVEPSIDAVHLAILAGGKESRELEQESVDRRQKRNPRAGAQRASVPRGGRPLHTTSRAA